MNSTSFRDCCGKTALVDAGSVFEGWPGAPGCTMAGADCCAQIDKDKKQVSPTAARSLPRETPLIRNPGSGSRTDECIELYL